MNNLSSQRAQLALLLVAFLWGLTFPLIRQAVSEISPFHFVFFRFTLATLIFLPLILGQRFSKKVLIPTILPGLGLGVVLWSSYLSQTLGLELVSSGRAAFVTGTNVIMVPLLAPLFRSGHPSKLDLLASVLVMFGLYLMTNPMGSGISVGDGWVLVCALTYAIYILCLQKVLNRADLNRTALAFFQALGVALCSLIVFPLGGSDFPVWSKNVWIALLFCSIFATIGTLWLQTRFQGDTTPQRAALIFATEPIFAAFFGFFLLGEMMSLNGYVGAAIIFSSIVGSEFVKSIRGRKT